MAYYDGVGVAKNHVAILKFPNETKFNYGKNLKISRFCNKIGASKIYSRLNIQ